MHYQLSVCVNGGCVRTHVDVYTCMRTHRKHTNADARAHLHLNMRAHGNSVVASVSSKLPSSLCWLGRVDFGLLDVSCCWSRSSSSPSMLETLFLALQKKEVVRDQCPVSFKSSCFRVKWNAGTRTPTQPTTPILPRLLQHTLARMYAPGGT